MKRPSNDKLQQVTSISQSAFIYRHVNQAFIQLGKDIEICRASTEHIFNNRGGSWGHIPDTFNNIVRTWKRLLTHFSSSWMDILHIQFKEGSQTKILRTYLLSQTNSENNNHAPTHFSMILQPRANKNYLIGRYLKRGIVRHLMILDSELLGNFWTVSVYILLSCTKNPKRTACRRYVCLSFSQRYGSYLKWIAGTVIYLILSSC